MSRMVLLRIVFTVLERIAPTAGGKLGFRLWCTPPKAARDRTKRRDDRPGPGRVSTVMMADERRVAVESWGPADGQPVYLLHGWGGWRGQMGGFIQPLADAGYRVVALDTPAHGDAGPGQLGGSRSHMQESGDALATVADAFGPPAAAIAHSGGCTAMAAAVRDGLEIPRMVFIAPSADPVGVMHRIADALGAGPKIRAAMRARAEELAGRSLDDYDVTSLAVFTTPPPTLVIHDDKDKEVPFSEGEAIVKSWERSTWHPTTGLGHRRILRDAGVIETVTAYLTDPTVAGT